MTRTRRTSGRKEREASLRLLEGRIEKTIKETGASKRYAHNVATHVINALTMSMKAYRMAGRKFGTFDAETLDKAAFMLLCRSVFSKQFNEITLPEEMRPQESLRRLGNVPCYQ